MSRSERRHHSERMKSRWVKRIRDIWGWPKGQADRYQAAVRRATHPRHDCTICRVGMGYDRVLQKLENEDVTQEQVRCEDSKD